MKRRWLLVVLAAGLAAPGATAGGASFAVAGGTWISGPDGLLLGPAWEMDAPSAAFGATVTGPGGFSRRIGGAPQRFVGMPSTRSIHWCNPDQCTLPAAAGPWTATGDDNSQVSFSIDPASRLTPVVLDKTSFQSGTGEVTGTWTAGNDAQSFVVYVQPANSTSATVWTAGTILPSGARTVTFSGLGLDPATVYSLDIFAFSSDITGGPLPPVFNVASDRLDFTPGQPVIPSPPTPSPPPDRPLTVVPGPIGGAQPALVFSPDRGALPELTALWRPAVPYATRTFSITLHLANTSSKQLTVVDVTTPEPAGGLLRQDKTTLSANTVAPHQQVTARLSYTFVGCSAAKTASTTTAQSLLITYRYGRQAPRHELLPIGASRVLALQPTTADCTA